MVRRKVRPDFLEGSEYGTFADRVEPEVIHRGLCCRRVRFHRSPRRYHRHRGSGRVLNSDSQTLYNNNSWAFAAYDGRTPTGSYVNLERIGKHRHLIAWQSATGHFRSLRRDILMEAYIWYYF